MRRRELLKILADHGAVFVREGGDHDVYRNPRTGRLLPVPRHTEVSDGVTRKLLKDAEQ